LRNRIPEAKDPNSNRETSDNPKLRGCKDSGEDLGNYDPESQSEDNIVAAKPYNLLLQSLVRRNKPNQCNPKCRKLHHTQTEEDGIILEDGEDLANVAEEEEKPEETKVIEVGSDNEDPSDPFESHFGSLGVPHLLDWLPSPPLQRANGRILSCLNLDHAGIPTYPFPKARNKPEVEGLKA